MYEPVPCFDCGRFHEPGTCSRETEDTEAKKLQERLESYLVSGDISNAETVIALAQEKGVSLDLTFVAQRGLEECLVNGLFNSAELIVIFGVEKNIFLDIASTCQKALIKCLANGFISGVESIIFWVEEKSIYFNLNLVFQKGLEEGFKSGNISNVEKIITLAKEKGISLDLPISFQKGLEESLALGYIYYTEEIIFLAEKQGISLDFSRPEITDAFQKGLEECLVKGSVNGAEEIIFLAEKQGISLDFSRPEITDACQKGLETHLANGLVSNTDLLVNWAKEKNISLDFSRPEITDACQKGLETHLANGLVSKANLFIFWVLEHKINLDISSVLQRGLEKCLKLGKAINAKKVIVFAEERGVSLDLVSAFRVGLEHFIKEGSIYNLEQVTSLLKEKGVSLDITSVYQQKLEHFLMNGSLADAIRVISFAKTKNISLDFSRPEVTEACQKGLEKSLAQGNISFVNEFINFVEARGISLDFSLAEVAFNCQLGLEKHLANGLITEAEIVISFAKEKGISLDLAFAFQKGLENCLSFGLISEAESVIVLAGEKGISLDFSQTGIASSCKMGLTKSLLKGDVPNALAIIAWAEKKNIFLDVFSVCKESIEHFLFTNNINIALEINNRIAHLDPGDAFNLYSRHLAVLLAKIEKELPDLILKMKRSIELFFNLFTFRDNPDSLLKTLKDNPFLFKVLEENERFGFKLILKYPEFDKVSREKIELLFKLKEEIIAQNPDLDSNSLEFRKRIQERLRNFDRNQQIIQAAEAVGIDTANFLNYGETSDFILSTEDATLSFAEIFPNIRINNVIKNYIDKIKKFLKPHLAGIMVWSDRALAMKEEIKKLENQLNITTDPQRWQKMMESLRKLEQKLSATPKISLWEKISSELERLNNLVNQLKTNQEQIYQAEKEYNQVLADSAISSQEKLKLKNKFNKTKEEFKINLEILTKQFDNFRINLTPTLVSLGVEKAEELVQEINIQIAEDLNHYETDLNTLNELLAPKVDKERERLLGREMTVRIWSRNPDVDLYQGNYSPCCICIESQYLGGESAIADYNTDLGIQVINIYDKAKNEPVVAAWCWLGQDADGQTALVVDNIEANTLYSINFPQELYQQLLAYLKRYAEAVGVNRIVLGQTHNDLPSVFEFNLLPQVNSCYVKIGGFNSRPQGYYLEAENKVVRLLWEKS